MNKRDSTLLETSLSVIEKMSEGEMTRKNKVAALREVLRFKEESDFLEWSKAKTGVYHPKFIEQIGKCVGIWLDARPWTQRGWVRSFGKNALGLGIYRTTPTKIAVDEAIGELRDKELATQVRIDVESKENAEREAKERAEPKEKPKAASEVKAIHDVPDDKKYEAMIASQTMIIQQLQADLNLRTQEINKLKGDIDILKAELKIEQEKNGPNVGGTNAHVRDLEQRLLRSEGSSREIHQLYSAIQVEYTKLQAMIMDLRQQHPKDLAAYQQRIDQGQGDLKEARDTLSRIQQDNQQLRSDLEAERKNSLEWKQKFEAVKAHGSSNVRSGR